jgi:hypothetical protein
LIMCMKEGKGEGTGNKEVGKGITTDTINRGMCKRMT